MPSRGTKTTKKSAPIEFSGTAPRITYEMSFTKNLGDYESLRVSARVELDADFEDSDLDAVDNKLVIIRERLSERLIEDISEITGN